ncbi:polysaccharide pyruvyl transferase family protein [Alteromonas aestuariivivens]|uniref:Polysaccharide pyruvyl transferase family protein n=1 Tax=Alteromonas aestuariivivens TaxID=1938339 RepID=A0A3D8M9E9_9ALTE|nr:polysaccharide pyruvyl transferase family protein [Alteromonas aestuariivivens]RDV26571.1 polysaccharide pyruvyl transferase family protein [Alteromonas aestuariivivens]
MKKVGIVGTRGRIDGCSYLDTDELLHKVGANTGNLLFQYAVCNLVDEDYVVIGEDIPWDIELIKRECRILVIPSANFVRENFDFTGFVDFLDKTGLPLTFLGLGAQAHSYDQKEFDFHPSIVKLLRLLNERCTSVSLRGEFTNRLLKQYGVHNGVVTGCPTNFINRDPNFTQKLANSWERPIFSFMATGDEPWPKDLAKRDAERKMIEWVAKGNGLFLQQSVAPFIKYARQGNQYQTGLIPEHHENSLKNSLAPWMSNEEFRAFIATRMRIYYCVDQWLEDSARVDFSIGLRLHGNMAAWQSGTPAIWVYHDSRTRELAETMALPHISVEKFLNCDSIEHLRSSVGFSKEIYEGTRQTLKQNLIHVLENAGIGHNLGG